MISAVIITKNEEDNIADCLRSLQGVVQEIIVVDSLSTDRTREICEGFGVRYFEREFTDYSDQKNYGNDLALYDYILSIDADERLSTKLRESILRESKHFQNEIYAMNRKTNYCGKWINYSGWYPDRKIRLWKKDKARWKGQIHEKLDFNSDKTGHLKGDILHYSYKSKKDHLERMDRYTDRMALELVRKKRKINIFHLTVVPVYKVVQRYFFKLGFLDGYYGLVIAVYGGYYAYLKYSKAIKLKNQSAEG